ncbi:MAG: 30S ribosomal protein S4 [Acidimicrobiaceae bacterium]|nr:30S ribosomal protein S4 [Acidimicrobiaceae bacterium]MXV88725.1 30S ribosomal protein S4 [Acidimicrobiales bacterium]MCY3609855.1 30S ribosomal protein S4 [Acidimicrobiaceae bacterium]MCY3892897.1 30S ribosomal protein S4 [Acidimicrobiaceae bacterium]MCY3949103.1 30S ribosomal protein S4 [Acidimicrobiaceae bacterium]
MSRYTGPKARVSRRLNTNIWGTEGETKALDRRPYPPGEHGRGRRRSQNSEFLLQLQEKQKCRFTYGMTERQFRNVYEEAARQRGVTGENLLRLLELRLDNIVYRAGWAATRPQARQFVSHGHIDVNGRRVNIPSFRARKDDVVELRTKAREIVTIRWNLDVLDRTPPPWLEASDGGQRVTVRELPIRSQIEIPVREQLIVELYSK